MKKLLLSLAVLSAVAVTAQVGINTDRPSGTFDAAYINPQEAPAGTKWANPATPQGLHLPNVSTAQRSQFEDVREGMMIYNTDKQCLEVYLGVRSGAHQWECIPNVGNKSSQGVAVSPAGFSGKFMRGEKLSGASVSFTITNNGFSPITNIDFSDAVGVEHEGIIIEVDGTTNNSVSLNEGESKTLTYTLSGAPRADQLTAIFNKFGLSAEQQLMVGKGNANLQNQEQYIVSFAHDGKTIQGNIDNASNQISLKIPYTNGKGSYEAVSITQDAAEGQDGKTKPITLSIPAGNFAVQGELTATLSVGEDGLYQVMQMKPEQSYDIVTYDIDINGSRSKVIIKGIGGIPDRKFGEETNGELRHQFVYAPVTVTGANGYNKTWLNLNLGAAYADINNPNFNPNVNKTGEAIHSDENLYGSLYQWQRANDGHEFRNQPTAPKRAPNWKDAGSSAGKFIAGGHNWVANGENASGSDLELWRAGRDNNPCPSGYHVPTIEEWQEFHQAVTGSRSGVKTNQMWTQDKLPNLAAAAYRFFYLGQLGGTKNPSAFYWSSSSSYGRSAHRMSFKSDLSGVRSSSARANAFSVRCIKD